MIWSSSFVSFGPVIFVSYYTRLLCYYSSMRVKRFLLVVLGA